MSFLYKEEKIMPAREINLQRALMFSAKNLMCCGK